MRERRLLSRKVCQIAKPSSQSKTKMAQWLPFDAQLYQRMRDVLQAQYDVVFLPPPNAWAPQRRAALRKALNLADNDNGNRIVNMAIAASARSYLANAAITPQDMLEAGWVIPAGDALNRLAASEANVASLQHNIALILHLLQKGNGGGGGSSNDESVKLL